MVLSFGRLVAAGVLLGACGGATGGAAPEGPYVVATTSIWADITRLLACDGAFEVRSIVPAGTDAHAYEPSLSDRKILDEAALVVSNGLDLEESLIDTLEVVAANGVTVVEVADHVETLDGDPHVWFDPNRVATALPAIGDALVEAGADRAAVDRCVGEARSELQRLDAEVEATLAAIPTDRRLLVTNHDALGYLADRYGLRILGTVLPTTSTMTAASPAELEALADTIRDAGVPAIFTETFAAQDDADALADTLGVEVIELHTDALGPEGSGAETYAGLLRTDAAAIADALSG